MQKNQGCGHNLLNMETLNMNDIVYMKLRKQKDEDRSNVGHKENREKMYRHNSR